MSYVIYNGKFVKIGGKFVGKMIPPSSDILIETGDISYNIVYFNAGGSGIISVDWGDGSSIDNYDLSEYPEMSHEYSDAPVSPIKISNVAGLTKLYINYCDATNITIPSSCTSLQTLYINDNTNLTTFTLSNLENLQDLTLSKNYLSSVSLSNFPSLANLNLSNNNFSSYSIPAELTSLNSFAISNNSLSNFSIPAELTSLNSFAASNNQLANVTIPSGLGNLTSLNLYNNQLGSFVIDSSWVNINIIRLNNNLINDVSIINQILIDLSVYAFSAWQVGGGTLYLNGGTNAIPTGDAITAKTELENLENTIVVTSLPYPTEAYVYDEEPRILQLSINESLNEAYVPAITAFIPSGGRNTTDVSIAGNLVYITVDASYENGDTITIGYTKPGINALRSAIGEVESFSDFGVTNYIYPIPYPVSAQVSDEEPEDIIITCNESMYSGQIPATSTFTPSGGRTATNISVSGTDITVSVDTPYEYGDTISISYSKPESNPLISSDCAKALESFSDFSVTNNVLSAYPTLQLASVRTLDASAILLEFDRDLDREYCPSTGAFNLEDGGKGVIDVSILTASDTTTKIVRLYLDGSMAWNESVSISYTIPGINQLRGTNGYDASAFTSITVRNLIYNLQISYPTGASSSYSALRMQVSSDISIYTDGVGVLADDDSGTNQSQSKAIPSDSNLHSIFVKCATIGTANLQFSNLSAITHWGDPSVAAGWEGYSSGYPRLDVSVLRFSSLEEIYLRPNGPLSFDITDFPEGLAQVKLNSYGNAGAVNISFYGDIANLPSTLTHFEEGSYFSGYSSNIKLYGNLADLPSGITFFEPGGLNRIGEYDPSGRIWASNMNLMYMRSDVSSNWDSTKQDALLIDLANTSWEGYKIAYIRLRDTAGNYVNRTSYSDAAVATLEGMGVTVTA
jgi:hypothetical protein